MNRATPSKATPVHEQYFWPFYRAYVPDHAQRCEAAIRWATDHGYKPVFFHERFLGGPE